MAYDTLKAEIRQYIQTNGQQEITGQILQNVLLDMVNAYPSLDGYATQQWVQNQGYVTASALSGYATQEWVNTQLGGYLPLTGGTLTGDLNMAYSHKLNFGTSYIYQSTIPGPQGTNMGHILNFYGVDGYGYYDFDNSVHATSFVKAEGTSAQFLKADGSVDENAYITASALNGYATQSWIQQQGYITESALSDYATKTWVNTQLGGYLPLTGGTLTGDLNMAYSSKLNFGTSYMYETTIPGPQGTNMGHILNFHGVDGYGYYDFDNSVHATSFVKANGTADEVLCADGSVKTLSELKAALNAI
jgi:hypothetical protein